MEVKTLHGKDKILGDYFYLKKYKTLQAIETYKVS